MSVVGVDFGSLYSQIAVCRRGGVDVIANEVSSRNTTTMVSFGEKERLLGEAAVSQQVLSPKDTIAQIKRLIGRRFDAASVQEELKNHFSQNKTVRAEDGNVGFEVNYQGKTVVFTPTQIAAMMFTKLKKITEHETQNGLKDLVIAVPGFWTSQQRMEFLNAVTIPNLNCLRLVNEHTATALAFGLYRTDFSETDPTYVMFVDIGYTSSTCSITAFTKNGLEVKNASFDSNVGGRDFDRALALHLAGEIKEKYKIDVTTNTRAWLRLLQGCEKVKKTLSANPKAPLNLECLMDDKDVRLMVERDTFDQVCQPLYDKIKAVIDRALSESGLGSKLSSVEVIGGSIRVPAVQKIISDATGQQPSFTLNAAEAVAKGAALMCAILSPAFRVRDYKVVDFTIFPVNVTIKKLSDGSTETMEGFPYGTVVPFTKNITVPHYEEMEITLTYGDSPYLINDAKRLVGTYKVGPALPQISSTDKHLEFELLLNAHGIVVLNGHVVEKFEEMVPKNPPAAKQPKQMETKQPDQASADKPTENGTVETNGVEAEKKPEGEAMETDAEPVEQEMVRKMRTKIHGLQLSGCVECLTSVQGIQSAVDQEKRMQDYDQLCVDTAEAKNNVESYLLSIRGRVQDDTDLYNYVEDSTREMLCKLCNELEDWLYDEGENEPKEVYVQKLKTLKDIGNPIVNRKKEAEERVIAFEELKTIAAKYRQNLGKNDYQHIEKAEKEKVRAECDKIELLIAKEMKETEEMPKHQDPKLWASFIHDKIKELEKFCHAILSKPKPKPKPKEEPKKEEPKKDDGKKEDQKPAAPKEEAPQPAPQPAPQEGPAPMEEIPQETAPTAEEAAAEKMEVE